MPIIFAVAVVALLLAAAFVLWRQFRIRDRGPGRSRSAERALDAHATTYNYLRARPEGDAELYALAERLHGLAGEPFGRLPGVSPVERAALVIDCVLFRMSPLGRELFVASYRKDGWDLGRTLAARTIDDAPAGFTLDDDRLIEGTLPSGFGTGALHGLPRGTRLRLAGGWVMLSIRGDLDPGIALRLTARLADLHGQLAAWRQHHPHRAPHLTVLRW
jgi:hypothetical protein